MDRDAQTNIRIRKMLSLTDLRTLHSIWIPGFRSEPSMRWVSMINYRRHTSDGLADHSANDWIRIVATQYYHIPSTAGGTIEQNEGASSHGKIAYLNRMALNPRIHTFFAEPNGFAEKPVGIASWEAPGGMLHRDLWRQQNFTEKLWAVAYRIWDAIMIPLAKRVVRVGYVLHKRDRWAAVQADFRGKTHTATDQKHGYWTLQYLAVLPDHAGRGIASRLMQWGCNEADKGNFAIYLSASPQGRHFYLKHGFKVLAEKECFTGEECGGWTETYMRRPRLSERKSA